MVVGVKLLHLVSDNNLITVVHRFVLSPATKVYRFLVVLFVLGNGSFADPSCLISLLSI